MLKNSWGALRKSAFFDTFGTIFSLVIFAIGVYFFLTWISGVDRKRQLEINEANKVEMNTTCPSLLSITRSSRDTLIVMRVVPLCTNYVLSNLK